MMKNRLLWSFSMLMVIVFAISFSQADARTWTKSTVPFDGILDVSYGNSIYVAVGTAGNIYKSSDGQNWIKQVSGVTSTIWAVEYGNGLFVASGDSGKILTSTDGINWTPQTSNMTSSLNYVKFVNGNFISTSSVSGKFVTSTDGVTWTAVQTSFNGLVGITYANGKYYIAEYYNNSSCTSSNLNRIITSSDLVNWSTITTAGAGYSFELIYANNRFLISQACAVVQTSTDGTNWTKVSLGISNENFLGAAFFNNQYYVFSKENNLYASSDAATWSSGTKLFDTTVSHAFPRLKTVNNRLFAFVMNSFSNVKLKSTTNGTTWTDLIETPVGSETLNDVTYGSGKYVAVSSTGKIHTSGDGVAWDYQGGLSSSALQDITYGNGQFIAVGNAGVIQVSTDASSWSSASSGITDHLYGVAFGNGTFVTVGASGVILSSTNGTTWSNQTSPTTNQLNNVQYLNNQFIAVGNSGSIVTSTNGSSWSNQTSPVSTRFNSVAFGNGQYVIVGLIGSIITSTDGTNWTDRTNGSYGNLQDVSFQGNRFVAAGTTGKVYYSTDGITWTAESTSVTTVQLNGVAGTSSDWVAVGASGTIIRSDLKSSDADLTNVSISGGGANVTYSPSFASNTTTYSMNVDYSVSTVTVTPTFSNAMAIALVNGVVIPSTATGATVSLQVGSNTVTVKSVAEDGTDKTYTLNITRSAGAAPIATSVTISGTNTEGQVLTGSYTYTDVDSDAEGTSTFKWYRSDDASGTNKSAISGATSTTYTLQAADLGKYISFEVTPVASAGLTTGTAVESTPVGAVQPAAPSVTSVSVPSSGTYTSGQNLDFTVNVDQNVTVNTSGGTPRIAITLNTGGSVYASYVSGSGTSALVFRYMVGRGTLDADGITLGSSIDLNSGTIEDSSSNALLTTLNGVGATSAVLVDGMTHVTVSGITATNRAYDGSTTVSVDISNAQLVGAFGGDTVSVDISTPTLTGTIASQNVGNSKSVTYGTVTLTGAQASYYVIDSYNAVTVNITEADLTLSGTRVYDGTTTIDGSMLTSTGVNGETFTVTGSGDASNLSSKNVQTNQALATVTGLSLGTSTNGGLSSNYNVLSVSNSTVSITTKTITITAPVITKTYDGGTTYTPSSTELTTMGSVLVGTDTLSAITLNYVDKHVGSSNKTVTPSSETISDGNGGANYTVSYASNSTSSITAKTVTLTAPVITKTYDGGTMFTTTTTELTDLSNQLGVSGDTVTAITLTYTGKNAGTANKTVTPSAETISDGNNGANYSVSYGANSTSTISAKAVTLTAPVISKAYDGGTSFTTTSTELTDLSNQLGVNGDTVTAITLTYTGKNVGTSNKTVTPSSETISDGNSGANYNVSYASNSTSTITAKTVTLTAPVITKTYDGGTTYTTTGTELSNLSNQLGVNGDTVTAISLTYTGKNVGTSNKTVTPSGVTISDTNGGSNYSVSYGANSTSTITAKTVTLTAPVITKTYDGGTTFTTTTTELSNLSNQLGVNGDTVTAITLTYTGKNAGTGNKTVTPSAETISDGNNGANYSVSYGANSTSTISAKVVTLTAPVITKTYDGGTSFTTTGTELSNLSNQLGVNGDTVTGITLTYTGKNIGTGNKTVTPSSVTISDGNGGSNYSVSYASNSTSSITAKAVTLTAPVITKTYDGGTTFTTTATELSNLTNQLGVNGDTVTTITLTYTGKNIDTGNKTVTPSAVTINDTNGGSNYSVSYATNSTSTISAKVVTLTAPVITKTYDGGTTFTTTATELSNLSNQLGVNGDTVTAITLTYTGKNAGSGNKTVTPSAETISDGNNGANYSISFAASSTSSITAKTVTLKAPVITKTYDGGTSFTTTGTELSNLSNQLGVNGDTVTGITLTYTGKNIGTGNKTVTPSAVTISDTNGGSNYSVSYVANSTSTISAKTVTLTAPVITKTYDGGTTFTTTATELSNLTNQLGVNGDTVTTITLTYTGKNIDTGNKTVTPSAVTISDTNGGSNYSISYASNSTSTISAKVVTLTAPAITKTYDGGTTFTTTATELSNLSNQLGVNGDSVTAITLAYTGKNAGSGNKTVTPSAGTISDGNNGSNYSISYAASSTSTISAKAVTLTAPVITKTYDGGTSFTSTGTELTNLSNQLGVNGDTVTGITLTYTGKNIGTGNKTVTPSAVTISDTNGGSNYSVSYAPNSTSTITAKTVTLTAPVITKTYDGGSSFTTTGTELSNLSNQLGVNGDTVTAITLTFTGKNVGTSNKTVTPSAVTINDTNGGSNYSVSYGANSTSTITAKTVTLTAPVITKTYDGGTTFTTTATELSNLSNQLGVNGDTVTAITLSYTGKNSGSGNKTVTPSAGTISDGNNGSNYSVSYAPNSTSTISAKVVTLTAPVITKTYDGVTSFTTTGTELSNLSNQLGVNGDTVTGITLTYTGKNIGSGNKTVTPSAVTISDTNGGSNYSVSYAPNSTSTITAKTVTLTAPVITKTYDGGTTFTTTATELSNLSNQLGVNGDTVTAITLTYTGKNAGSGNKTVTPSGVTISDGNDGENYIVNLADNNTSSITPKTVTLTAPIISKIYDGTTTHEVTSNELSALTAQLGILGDTVDAITVEYADANVGSATKTANASAATISDGNNGENYSVIYASNSASTIQPKEISISGITAKDKVYDSKKNASLITSGLQVNGLIGLETFIPDGTAVGEFDTKNIGAGKTVTITGLSLPTIGTATNYVLSVTPITTTAEITKKSITVINLPAQSKTYDGTKTVKVNFQTAELDGVEALDDVQLVISAAKASFVASGVGARKVPVTDLSISGTDASNYDLTPYETTAVITPREVSVTGIQAVDKMYDSTTNASLSFASLKLDGLVGDNVSVDQASITASFASKQVGAAKAVRVKGIKLTGSGSENYSVESEQNAMASITAKPVTLGGITLNAKKEDGTTTASANFASAKLAGVLVGDQVTANTATATATYSDATVGENKPVAISGVTLDGTDANNYELSIETLQGTIDKKVEDPIVLVNGEVQEKTATSDVQIVNNQEVVTVTIDPEKLEKRLAAEENAVVTIPVKGNSDVVVGELNAQMVKNMENKEATLEIKTDRATYTLPAQQINIADVSSKIGAQVALQDIKIRVEISKATDEQVKRAEEAAKQFAGEVIVQPVNFEIKASYGDQEVQVSKFNLFVEREISIPDGVDPSKITTGVLVKDDGTIVHVPTQIVLRDGKYFAKINSLTNSTYTVIWNVKTFDDIQTHWAKASIENMASRLIVNGKSEKQFDANSQVTRAEFASMVVRALGLTKYDHMTNYKDIQSGSWYFDAIQIANQYGLIKGYDDGNFRPDGNITREEATIILGRAMKLTKMDTEISSEEATNVLASLKDNASISSYAKSSVGLLMKYGVMGGFQNRFNAKSNITRAETAATIERFLQKTNLIEVKK